MGSSMCHEYQQKALVRSCQYLYFVVLGSNSLCTGIWDYLAFCWVSYNLQMLHDQIVPLLQSCGFTVEKTSLLRSFHCCMSLTRVQAGHIRSNECESQLDNSLFLTQPFIIMIIIISLQELSQQVNEHKEQLDGNESEWTQVVSEVQAFIVVC